MIKVVMIAPYPADPSNVKGGVEAVTVNLVSGFEQLSDVQLHVLSIQRVDTLTTVQVSPSVLITYVPQDASRNKRLGLYFRTRKVIRGLVEKAQPDIVHIQGNGPQLLVTAGLDKQRLVLTQHGIIREELKNQTTLKGKAIYLVNSWIEQLCTRNIRNFIFISSYNRTLQLERMDHPQHEALIANPVNAAFFNVAPPDMLQNRILFVGGVRKGKGLLDLLSAVALLNQQGIRYEVEVVGGVVEPAYNEQVLAFIAEQQLTDRIFFNDWISQDAVLKLYPKVQLLVLPSLQENLPVCIAEALAAGRVVIASETGGIPEMITHEQTGFLFEKGNAAQLAAILLQLHDKPELRTQIAEAGRKKALESYDPVSVARQTARFYQSVYDQKL